MTPFTFTVTRSGDPSASGSIDYRLNYDNKSSYDDFNGISTGARTIDFAPGEVSKTLSIEVLGDTIPERNEGFYIALENPSTNATITTGRADGLILNDDIVPIVSNITDLNIAGL